MQDCPPGEFQQATEGGREFQEPPHQDAARSEGCRFKTDYVLIPCGRPRGAGGTPTTRAFYLIFKEARSVFPSKIPPLFCVFRVWDTPHVFRSFRVPHALRRSFLEGGDFEVLVNTGTQGRLTQARESWRERPASRRPPDPQGPRRGAESEGLFHGKLEKAARAFLSASRPPESCFESTSFLLGLTVPWRAP